MRTFGWVVTVFAVACGAESPDGAGASSTAPQTTTGVADTEATTTEASTSTTGASSAASTTSAPGTSGAADATSGEADSSDETGSSGAQPTDDRLFPLEIGRSWTYAVTAMGDVPTCAGGTHTEEVLGMVEVAGEDAFEMTSFCSAVDRLTFRIDGDVVDLENNGSWIRTLDEPVEDGHNWNSTGPIDYTWRSEGDVTVPAGTFTDCWTRVQVVAYTAETTFCRGVGMVRSLSSDLNGWGWDAVLSSVEL